MPSPVKTHPRHAEGTPGIQTAAGSSCQRGILFFWGGVEVGWLVAGDSSARPGERSLPERLSHLETKAKFGPSPSGRARQPLWETSSCGISRRQPRSAGPRAAKGDIELLPEPGTGAGGGRDTAHQVRGAPGTGEGGKKSLGRAQGRSDRAARGILRSSAPDEGSWSSSYLTPNPRVSLQGDGKGRGCVPCWH